MSGADLMRGIGGEFPSKTPIISLLPGNPLIGHDDGLFRACRPHQAQQPRDALPAHIHTDPNLRHADMCARRHDAEVQRDRAALGADVAGTSVYDGVVKTASRR
jgi:hypothetical protein